MLFGASSSDTIGGAVRLHVAFSRSDYQQLLLLRGGTPIVSVDYNAIHLVIVLNLHALFLFKCTGEKLYKPFTNLTHVLTVFYVITLIDV